MQSSTIALICFGVDASSLRKQPWHSAWGIAHGLTHSGFDVALITDAKSPPDSNLIHIVCVDHIYSGSRPSAELLHVIEKLCPVRIIIVAGTQELLRVRRFQFSVPVTLLLANQRFSLHELSRISLVEWIREWRMLKIPLLQAMLPSIILRRQMRHSNITHLLFLSFAAQKSHYDAGLVMGSVIRPRIDIEFIPVKTPDQNNLQPVFCFFGSPLFLRGIVDIIDAFVKASRHGLCAKLVLYIRVDDAYTRDRAVGIRRHIESIAAEYSALIDFVDDNLSPELLSERMSSVDVFVLPFKITVSDVPLVVIEAAARGRPVITYDTPGVSEWGSVFPNILLCEPAQLADTLLGSVLMPARITKDIDEWADWTAALKPFADTLRNPLDISSLVGYRMVCLVGVDGCGKTTLLSRLSEQLGVQQHAHSYLWTRFRNYLSKPLLALTRLTGHNRKIVVNGVRVGLHEFRRNKFLSRLFLMLQRCDMLIDIMLRVRPRVSQGMILGDRCAIDTLVDLAVDTDMDDVIFGKYGLSVLRWMPQPMLIVVVERNSNSALAARPDIASDPFYERRKELYRRLARSFGFPLLDNNGDIEQGVVELCKIAREEYCAKHPS